MVILYVDDDGDDLDLFGDALREVDATAIFIPARSGEAALTFLDGEIFPDLIVMDINMPVMDGLTCLSQIRNNPKFQHLPVVMLSTSTNDRDIDHSKSLGADFMSKPNSFTDLVNAIASWMKK